MRKPDRQAGGVSDLLTMRECERCRYPMWPGDEHIEMVQPEGSNVVVCKLDIVKLLRQVGPCKVCGVWSGHTFRVDTGETVERKHDDPADEGHEADPGSAPLVGIISEYLDRNAGPQA